MQKRMVVTALITAVAVVALSQGVEFAAGRLGGGRVPQGPVGRTPFHDQAKPVPTHPVEIRAEGMTRSAFAAQQLNFMQSSRFVVSGGRIHTSRGAAAVPGAVAGPLNRLRFKCHGGILQMVWRTTNLEPTHKDTGIAISIYLDNKRLNTMLKGSTDGVFNDGPAFVSSVRRCSKGEHEVVVRIDSMTGEWGVPYATDEVRSGRSLWLTERY